MRKSARAKSTARKPLADISNGGKPCKKKTPPPVDDGDDDGALDRLILARSDLSNIINQIDELVVQALQLKMISRRGSQDIESFRHVLSDMHSSLKPWVSRLQQALSIPKTDASGPCTKEAKISESECGFFSLNFSNHKSRKNTISLLTPCLKNSPPKSCALANPIQDDDGDIPKPTQENETQVSDDLTFGEVSASLAPKYYEELLELQPSLNFTSWNKDLDGTLEWFLSPPKTCILMEPSDGKLLPTPATGALLATPMLDFESTVRRGKQLGENTLKRELWIKFDAVSTNGLRFNASVFQKTARKGFMDMLEEASCVNPEDSDSRVAR